MKKIIIAALFTAFAVPAFSQAGNVFDLQTKKFAREGSVVNVEFTIGVDGKKLSPTETWTLTPVIRSANNARELAPVVINGNNKRRMIERERILGGHRYAGKQQPMLTENIRRRDVRTIEYNVSVPYEDWMKGASLVLDESCIACSNEFAYTENMGEIYAPQPPAPYVISPNITFVDPKQEEIKERAIAATAFIDFAVSRSEIQRNFRRNPQELDKIKATLDDVKGNSDMTFKGIFIEGFASPEGSYANNDRLARERVESLKNYVSANFGVPSDVITISHTAEDWAGLRNLVEQSFIDGKDEILAVIDGGQGSDEKEASLKKIMSGAPWKVIMAEMMPALRRTDYRVDFTVKEYNVQDSREVLEKNPSLLSHYELDLLAREYGENSAQYNRIYGLIELQFPTDDDANLNVAAYKIKKGDYAGARINLDRVANKGAAYYNNYGVVMMMQGNYSEARRYFEQAGQDSAALKNLGEVNKFLEVQREIDSYK